MMKIGHYDSAASAGRHRHRSWYRYRHQHSNKKLSFRQYISPLELKVNSIYFWQKILTLLENTWQKNLAENFLKIQKPLL